MNKQKGFTLIELIVVIAIIAILAAIVLVNVTQYINKSKTAAIQANLDTLKTQGAAYFADITNASNFGADFEADTVVGCRSPVSAAITNNSGTLVCHGAAATQAWCASSVTPTPTDGTNSTWCVDSAGFTAAGDCAGTVCVAS